MARLTLPALVLAVATALATSASALSETEAPLEPEAPAVIVATGAKQITWDDLLPADTDPFAWYEEVMKKRMTATEGSQTFERMTEVPVVKSLDGQKIYMPGYVVPLDFEATEVKEFFLVPFIGACIHVPPPPPNQIVWVELDKPVKIREVFDAVWVAGTMETKLVETDLAQAGYQLKGTAVAPYEW